MNFSNLWKGLAVVAVLFLFSMEASAQLPVRTQNLQLINPAGGTLTHTMTQTPATATAQSYTVVWPATQDHDNGPNSPNDQAILLGTWSATNTWTLEWIETEGFVDGTGDVNHVTWWNPDSQTLDHSQNFEWNGTRLGVGMNAFSTTAEATGAGEVVIGDGTAAQIQLNVVGGEGTFGNATTAGSLIVTNATGATVGDIDGATATATIGSVGAGAAGTINVTSATAATNGVVLDGAAGTATVGNTGISGEVVFYDGEAAPNANTATLSSGIQVENQTITFDIPDALAPGSRIIPLAINTAQTPGQILFSVGNGTAEWRSNPSDYIQSGVVPMAGGLYTQSITFPTDYSSLVPIVAAGNISVTVTCNGAAADANILQVTNISQTGFDVLSSAPLAGATINWIAVGRP